MIANGGSENDAKAYLKRFFENTVALPGSARDATTAFQSGNGDVLMGTSIAWVLVRDEFPGKAILDVVIDIPFRPANHRGRSRTAAGVRQ